MTPSRKSLTLYMVITALGAAGTMMMGVLKRLSERGERGKGRGRWKEKNGVR